MATDSKYETNDSKSETKEITVPIPAIDTGGRKAEIKGQLKVDRQTITFAVPNRRGLTLEQVESSLADDSFCGGCHGVLTAVGSFIW